MYQKPKAKTFPKRWIPIVDKEVLFYRKLSSANKVVFRKRMMAFLARVNVEAVGFEITDLDTVLVAASAIIPVFNFPDWEFNNLDVVLIYPDSFDADLEFTTDQHARNIGGMVGDGQLKNHMILSRKSLHHGFKNTSDKGNTGVHEFVHLIDKTNGAADGVPEVLLDKQYIQPWLRLMHQEMDAIHNNESDIRKYGATNEAEFFAVASEYFFERPDLFKEKHPELYEMLRLCFTQHRKVS